MSPTTKAPKKSTPAVTNGTHEIFFDIEEVGPIKARKYLDRNVRNRPLKPSVVARYAHEMKNGRWVMNGDTVKFDPEGNLLDGQHRLEAIIVSASTQLLGVARNVPATAFATLDQGRKRSPGDHLALIGESDSNHLAVAVAYLARYDRGDQWATRGPEKSVSGPEIVMTLAENQGLRNSLSVVHGTHIVGSRGMFAFVHYVAAKQDKEKADTFIHGLAHGDGLEDTDAVWRLRELLIRNRLGKTKLTSQDVLRYVIIAWNKHRLGEPCRSLRLTNDNPDFE